MHNTIALYTTETMTDWEYAYLTTQIAGAEQLKPGRFRLLLVGDGLESVRTLGNLPLTPEADLDTPQAPADAAPRLLHLFGYDGERAPTVLFPDHPHQMRSAQIDRYYIVRHHKFIF